MQSNKALQNQVDKLEAQNRQLREKLKTRPPIALTEQELQTLVRDVRSELERKMEVKLSEAYHKIDEDRLVIHDVVGGLVRAERREARLAWLLNDLLDSLKSGRIPGALMAEARGFLDAEYEFQQ